MTDLLMTDNATISPPDNEFLIYCPKLGHQIFFAYCRTENMGTPCIKALDCWFHYFPVTDYLRSELTPEEWSATFETPRTSKVVTLATLIEKAQNK